MENWKHLLHVIFGRLYRHAWLFEVMYATKTDTLINVRTYAVHRCSLLWQFVTASVSNYNLVLTFRGIAF